jgi:hypothetical protein
MSLPPCCSLVPVFGFYAGTWAMAFAIVYNTILLSKDDLQSRRAAIVVFCIPVSFVENKEP